MAYKQISPQVVAEGGTGVGSTTVYAVLCGGTTSTGAIQSIASVGTAAQVLTSNGAALPTFQAAAAAAITGPGSSTDNALARWNGVGGDTLQDSTVIVNDNGQMTNASQPAFFGYLSSDVANLTGDNTAVILGDSDVGAGLTEVFDQSSSFVPSQSGGAQFTSPVDGKCIFYATNSYLDVESGTNSCRCFIITSNQTYGYNLFKGGPTRTVDEDLQLTTSCVAIMDITDTAEVQALVSGGTKVVDLAGLATSTVRTVFAGYLNC